MNLFIGPSIYHLSIYVILKQASSLMGKPRDILGIITPLFHSYWKYQTSSQIKKMGDKNWNEIKLSLYADSVNLPRNPKRIIKNKLL